MKKLISTMMICACLAQPVLAEDNPTTRTAPMDPSAQMDLSTLKEAVSKIEVYYTSSENNQEKLQDLGISGKIFMFEDCRMFDSWTSGKRRNREECLNNSSSSLEYLRVGTIDIGGLVGTKGHGSSINNATITLFEGMGKSGTSFHILRIGYVKDNRSQILEYKIPVSFGVGQNVDIKVSDGGALKIFIDAELDAGLGYYNMQDGIKEKFWKDTDEDGKDIYQEGSSEGFLAYARVKGRAGIKLFDRAAIGAVLQTDVQTPGLYSTTVGGEIRYKITKHISLHASATVTKRKVFTKSVYMEDGSKVKGDDIFQITGGVRGEF